MRILRFVAALLICGSVSFFTGCAALQTISQTVFMISPEQEAELGKEVAIEIEKQYPVYKGDPAATAYIESLGKRLAAAAPPSAFPYKFQLVKSDEVNAFAIPGGNVYIQIGLLRAAKNESELAAVVAHEIGHVVARHSAKSLSSSQFYSVIGQVLLGKDAGQLSQLAADIVGSGVLLRHSREAELEADAIAIDTLPKAGINPNGLITFFQTLSEGREGGRAGKFTQLFSTHPLTENRIRLAQQRISAMGISPQNLQTNSSGFQQVKARYPAN